MASARTLPEPEAYRILKYEGEIAGGTVLRVLDALPSRRVGDLRHYSEAEVWRIVRAARRGEAVTLPKRRFAFPPTGVCLIAFVLGLACALILALVPPAP